MASRRTVVARVVRRPPPPPFAAGKKARSGHVSARADRRRRAPANALRRQRPFRCCRAAP